MVLENLLRVSMVLVAGIELQILREPPGSPGLPESQESVAGYLDAEFVASY